MSNIKLYSILLLFGICLTSSCESWRGLCNGDIQVMNTIADTAIYVDGDPFVRDLFKSPVIFKHTAGENINIQVISTDIGESGFVVQTERKRSDITDGLHVIVVKPNSVGTATVEIIATDDCEGREVTTSFNVTVKDTTQ